jgi:hypothetical protein
VLALPSLEKPFHLFVTVDKGIASGVLTQNHGRQKPVAYLSKILDLVSKEWPECIQSVAASAGSRKLTCRGILIVSTPHQVRTILNQKVGRWLTDSRILKYEAILLGKNDLMLTSDDCLHLAKFPVGRQSSSLIKHCCLDLIKYQAKVRPDLQEIPFETGDEFFVASSSLGIKKEIIDTQ